MSRIIFKDPALQSAFDQDGYVQIPLLEPADIVQLKALYAQHMPPPPEGFFSSSYLPDFTQKKAISEAIVAVLKPRIAEYFKDFRIFGSAFLSKNPGERSQMPAHQDWTIVDERAFVAVNIWTPLQDVNQENGSLQVLKGSHAFLPLPGDKLAPFPVFRAPTMKFKYASFQDEIMASLTDLEVKATEAVVLNQALVHASPPNQTADCRLAITTGLVSGEAPLQFFYKGDDDALEIFEMEDDFLLQFENFHEDIFKRPTFGNSLGSMPYVSPPIQHAKVLNLIRNAAPEGKRRELIREKPGFFQRIMGMFGGK